MIRSTFATLNLANRALVSQQIGLDIVGHNIANANTDGFTRQAAEMQAAIPFTLAGTTRPQQPGQLGTGVNVVNIRRFRDSFLDLQFRSEQQLLGQWQASRDAISKVEQAFNEPSQEGLAATLSKFWNSWSSLANNPESQSFRKALVENAQTMTSQMNQLHRSLSQQQRDLDQQVRLRVTDVNNLTQQIARLNDQIVRIVGSGDQPNDLKDQRDVLLDKLAKLVNITYTEAGNGTVTVNIGGRTAVYTNQSFELKTRESETTGFSEVVWADAFREAQVPPIPLDPVNITSGQLFGDIQARDVTLAQTLESLNSIAAALITNVNEVHATGFGLNDVTGSPFFSGTGADDIDVHSAIAEDLDNVAAATYQLSPGDGSNALAIHDLQRALVMTSGTTNTTIEDFYAGLVANLGVISQQADGMAKNEQLLSEHLAQSRQSLGGVSLDEETTNLIRYQHAYNAAARVVTVVDEMLDRIINNMGIVGR